MRDLQIGLLFGIILGAVASYVLLQTGIIPSKSITQLTTQPISNKPSNAFQADNNLPYPLNLPAVSKVDVVYSMDGTIQDVKTNGSNIDVKIKSITGPNFPDPISIPSNFTISPAATSSATPKGPNKSAKDIKVGDRLVIDLSYSPQTKKTYTSFVQYVP